MFKRHRPAIILAGILLFAALMAIVVPKSITSTAQADDLIEPVVVNLVDVVEGASEGPKSAARALGARGIRGGSEIAALRRSARGMAPDKAVRNRGNSPFSSAPVSGTNFDSIDITGCCGGGASVPPDPEMAAGPNHLIAVVNVAFEIYDKSGLSLLGPATLDSFLGQIPGCTGHFDPNVLYDEKEDRFMIAADGNGTHYCVAVSQTNDPLGTYWGYAFPTAGAGEFFDYPHAGIGEDAIYVGANIFTTGFLESRVYALEKADMYVGAAAAFPVQNLGATQDTPQPMNAHGFAQGTWPGDLKHYIITETNFNGCDQTIFEWDGPFTGLNTFGSVATVDLCAATGVAAGFPVNAVQNGAGLIQANDWRPLDHEYRNGFGWTTMSIACNPGGGTVDCVRWAQISLVPGLTGLPVGDIGPEGAGVFSSNGDYRIFPDLAVNDCNDMAVGYTKTSAAIFPAVWFTGRESGDAPGTLQAEAQLKAGEIVYTAFDGSPHRWGDYSGMTIDPDGLTFWYLGEYSKNTGNPSGRWGTYVGSFTFPCGAPAKVFSANLRGSQEVPPVVTSARGIASFRTNASDASIRFRVRVRNITDADRAHIHCGAVGVNGPVGVTLFSGLFTGSGTLAVGLITGANPGNACGWSDTDVGDILAAMRSGDTYVNVHTVAFPAGEIRGQIVPQP